MKRYFESLVYTMEYDRYLKSLVHTMEYDDLYILLKSKGWSDEDIDYLIGIYR